MGVPRVAILGSSVSCLQSTIPPPPPLVVPWVSTVTLEYRLGTQHAYVWVVTLAKGPRALAKAAAMHLHLPDASKKLVLGNWVPTMPVSWL